jgi:hypothetical protein
VAKLLKLLKRHFEDHKEGRAQERVNFRRGARRGATGVAVLIAGFGT